MRRYWFIALILLSISQFSDDATKDEVPGTPLPTTITIYVDKSFTFKVKTAPTSYLLKKAAKIDKGSQTPGRESKGSVSAAQCKEIAEIKMKDLNANDLDAAVKIVEGSARSMGMEVRN